MKHEIILVSRQGIRPAALLLQVSIVLTSCRFEPAQVELIREPDGVVVRLGIPLDAVSLAPLVVQLRLIPGCLTVAIEDVRPEPARADTR